MYMPCTGGCAAKCPLPGSYARSKVLNHFDATIGKEGSVAWMFDRKGLVGVWKGMHGGMLYIRVIMPCYHTPTCPTLYQRMDECIHDHYFPFFY